PQGEGSLTVTLDDLNLTMNVLGQAFTIKGSKGKMTASLNGQAMPANASPAGQLGMDQLLGAPIVMKMSSTGQVLEVSGGQGGLSQVPGLSNVQNVVGGGLALPDHPVAPGDSWESKSTVPMPVGPGKTVNVETNTTNTLKSVAVKNGRQIAT